MNKSKIEWTDYSWNPIKGLCPVGCWYCYARKMYKRFKWDEELKFGIFGDCFFMGSSGHPRERIKSQKNIHLPGKTWYPKNAPQRIFVCSTMELFHPNIKKEWRDWIFSTIKKYPLYTFIILTKKPENIDRPMPDNVWLGVSVEDWNRVWRVSQLSRAISRVKFISFEPLLGNLRGLDYECMLNQVDWAIMGRLTGHGNKYDPSESQVSLFIDWARITKTPIFLKNNLKKIWSGPLIQEFPEVT